MVNDDEWRVVFYRASDGSTPVTDFLASLDPRTQVRFEWSIEQLRQQNVRAGLPLVRHIEGRLWELRRESNTNIFRLFYTLIPSRRILFLHGFQKKTQKTPQREIMMAQRRLEEFLARHNITGGEQ